MQKYIFFCRNSLILQKNVDNRTMNLTTSVHIPANSLRISHRQHILLMGSCFADEMGQKLHDDRFDCLVNPFGTLYNPMSILQSLERLLSGREFGESDLFQYGGLWHSWMHHGSFSGVNPQDTLDGIRRSFAQAVEFLRQTDVLVMTWGTNRSYFYQDQLVANCHKVPEKQFRTRDFGVEEIVNCTTEVLNRLWQVNPQLHVVLTVSPIRYVKYGLHESQLSKATLLLAADALQRQFPDTVHYFPAYEILMDELRDYRFYADDLVHPSSLAVQYVYERFTSCFVDKQDQLISAECRKLVREMQHRPLHPESAEYQRFRAQLEKKINDLKQRYPYLKI